jgi:hypothetical protein
MQAGILFCLLASPAQIGRADSIEVFEGNYFCGIGLWWEDFWDKFVYTATPAYTPPNNIMYDGTICDDRRCQSAHSGQISLNWNSSHCNSVQATHTWGVKFPIAQNLIPGLEANCSNSSTWACSTTTGTSRTDNISYTTPYGEQGNHDIEWTLAGTVYSGTEIENHYQTNTSNLKHWINLGGQTVTPCTRSVNQSAGPWHCQDMTCRTDRGGCGTPGMKCDGTNCSAWINGCPCDHNHQ